MSSAVRVTLIGVTLFLLLAGLGAGCQSDQPIAESVSVEAAGIVGDTTGPFAGRENIFGRIQDLAAGTDGTLYVLDRRWKEVREYQPDGELVSTILLNLGPEPGEVAAVEEFDVGSEDQLFLTSRQGRRVTILTSDGRLAGQFSVPIDPADLAVISNDVYLTGFRQSSGGGVVRRYSRTGVEEAAFVDPPGGGKTTGESGVSGRIVTTGRETLLYSYPSPYRIVEYSPDGECLREASGQPSFQNSGQNGGQRVTPEWRSIGLAVLESGHVTNIVRAREADTWYVDIFSPDLRFIERLSGESFGLEEFQHVTASGSYLYFSSSNPAPHVKRFAVNVE